MEGYEYENKWYKDDCEIDIPEMTQFQYLSDIVDDLYHKSRQDLNEFMMKSDYTDKRKSFFLTSLFNIKKFQIKSESTQKIPFNQISKEKCTFITKTQDTINGYEDKDEEDYSHHYIRDCNKFMSPDGTLDIAALMKSFDFDKFEEIDLEDIDDEDEEE